MSTAIVTGASAGLGVQLVKQIAAQSPEIDSFWLIARRASAMEALAKELPGKRVTVLPLDLCSMEDVARFERTLVEQKPQVSFLVNNAGCGFLGNVDELPIEKWNTGIDLNIRALTDITALTLPYMHRGSHIIFISSIASFCPNPRMTVYSSTKAYVSSFARGLHEELLPRGISVTAVCPGPMATEFTAIGGIDGNSKMFETLPYCNPASVAAGAVRSALRGRTFYTPTFFYKFYRFVAKVVPHSVLAKITKT